MCTPFTRLKKRSRGAVTMMSGLSGRACPQLQCLQTRRSLPHSRQLLRDLVQVDPTGPCGDNITAITAGARTTTTGILAGTTTGIVTGNATMNELARGDPRRSLLR